MTHVASEKTKGEKSFYQLTSDDAFNSGSGPQMTMCLPLNVCSDGDLVIWQHEPPYIGNDFYGDCHTVSNGVNVLGLLSRCRTNQLSRVPFLVRVCICISLKKITLNVKMESSSPVEFMKYWRCSAQQQQQ